METYRAFRIHQDAQGIAPVSSSCRNRALPRARCWCGSPIRASITRMHSPARARQDPAHLSAGRRGRCGRHRRAVQRPGRYRTGDAVVATGWGLSFDHDGAYAEYLCVPAAWLVPIPEGLDPRSTMILGTAGFTAALAVHRMLVNGQRPEMGPILVTGASGGVGCMAIAIFARLGYEVVALSGKAGAGGLAETRSAPLASSGAMRWPRRSGLWKRRSGAAPSTMSAARSWHRSPAPRSRTGTSPASAGRRPSTRDHRDALYPARRESARLQLGGCPATAAHRALGSSGKRLAPGRPGRLLGGTRGSGRPARVFEEMLAGKTHGRIAGEVAPPSGTERRLRRFPRIGIPTAHAGKACRDEGRMHSPLHAVRRCPEIT
jgi:acrylyl-CoA reductase (NADPH)